MKFTITTILLIIVISTASLSEIRFREVDFKGDKAKPYLRAEYAFKQRAYPNDNIPSDWFSKAIAQEQKIIKNSLKHSVFAQSQSREWTNIGPWNVGGRVKSIVVHPKDDDIVWIAAAAGGIWKTEDGGNNWRPLFDFENSLSMGSLAIDENNANVLYAGTGEAVMGGGNVYPGAGIYKSTDAGESWFLTGLSTVEAISKVYVHPMNSNLVIVGGIASNGGFYISRDAGNTWSRKLEGNICDITINRSNPNEFIVAKIYDGIFYTDDGGESWREIMQGIRTPGIGDEIYGRFSVQAAPSNFNIVYALFEDKGLSGDPRLYRSSNKGASWQKMQDLATDFFRGQGFYDNHLAIHPSDPDFVFAGGIWLYRSKDGFKNLEYSMKINSNNEIHVDQHALAFGNQNFNLVYTGNDGGMYKSTNLGSIWTDINNDLMITQFYAMGIDHENDFVTYGGTQDNGTLGKLDSDRWYQIFGGDGFDVFVDPSDSKIIYGSVYYGNPWKVDLNKMQAWQIVKGLDPTDQGLWHSPFIMDEENEILYLGRHALYESYDGGESWDKLVETKQQKYSALAVSNATSEEWSDIYLIWAGTEIGQLFRTIDGGLEWEPVHQNGLVNRFITDIVPSKFDPELCFVSLSGYGTPGVFKTTDMGESWVSISDAMPDAPVNALALHPENEDIIFAATDIGVYVTFNSGNEWYPYGIGLPRSPVKDIAFHKRKSFDNEYVLRIATHGRSMWEITLPEDVSIDPVIVSPAGGELLTGTTDFTFSWYGFSLPVGVEVSFDDGATWQVLTDSHHANRISWKVANINTETARVRVHSLADPEEERISNTFTISRKAAGSVLKKVTVTFVPYGIVHDGENSIWSTSLYENKLRRFNTSTFQVEREFTLPLSEENNRFTDITMDHERKIMYINRMNDIEGNGAYILTVDTNGTVLNTYQSPANNYPVGLAYRNGELICGERDGDLKISVIDPASGDLINEQLNSYQLQLGPRGMTTGPNGNLYQISTNFNQNKLNEVLMIEFTRDNMAAQVSNMKLRDLNGPINARGIDFDPHDKDIWISELVDENVGSIYKIGSPDAETSVSDEIGSNFAMTIYPNPAEDYTYLSFENTNQSGVAMLREITISDMLGREINRFRLSDNQIVHRLDCSAFSSGVFTVTLLHDGNPAASGKLVISK